MEYLLNGIKSINIKNKRKMKKLILVKTGKEVKVGDAITICKAYGHPTMDECYSARRVTINETTIPELINLGIIKVVNTKPEDTPAYNLDYYIGKIANRLGWKSEKVYNYLNGIDSLLPAAAFSIVLREIAIDLDKKYEDHIENSPEIYVINMFDGRITKANKATIKNYRNFAAFRTIEDAKIACRITRDILKDMFKSGK
jgi:hypothetical protein